MHNVSLVLLQVLLVIGLSRLVGLAFRRIGQPLVIGEIVAGIMLGPSLLGWIAPDLWKALFPAETIPFLNVLSQVGLLFFMFLIGLELNPRYLQGQLKSAIIISQTSILLPFAMGAVLALWLHPLMGNPGVSYAAFALFLGAAMSITAFPVLARIITEHNLQQTRLGTLALTCAAVDDVTAWCLLAVAIAVTRTNSFVSAIPTLIEAAVYVGFMLTLGRWFLKRLSRHYDRAGKLNQFVLALIYMGVVASGLITEAIGIHLIFGAFLLGAAMPKNAGLTRELAQKTEDFVLTFLLPIFFAYSGLRTQIGLLNQPSLWVVCGVILVVAIAGKFLGTYAAARWRGFSTQESAALGWLMNTRGLTELILLNIGLSLGVISPLLFTMLVIMALVTTFMTSPLLTWILGDPEDSLNEAPPSPVGAPPPYRILVPVANPATQLGLVNLAAAIAGTRLQAAIVNPLHLLRLEEDYAFASTPQEANRLIAAQYNSLQMVTQKLDSEVRSLVHPIVRIANDVARETAHIAEQEAADLVLVGWHRPAFTDNRLGGRVGQILSTVQTDVAVFLDRPSPTQFHQLLVPYIAGIHNDLGLELALRILVNRPESHLTVLQITTPEASSDFSFEFRRLLEQLPGSVRDRLRLAVTATTNPLHAVIVASESVDLTIAGASREWGVEKQTLGYHADALSEGCRSPLLITRRHSRVTSHLAAVLATAEA